MGVFIAENHQSSTRSVRMMKHAVKLISVLLLALLFILPAQPAAASNGHFDGQIIFGQFYTLKSGDTLEGNLLVFGGSATIEKGATVNGSVVLFGGTLTVDGSINGDVAVTGGGVNLGSGSHVSGNLTTVAATLDRADGARIDGQVYNTSTTSTGGSGVTPPVINVGPLPSFEHFFSVAVPNTFKSLMGVISESVGLALLAMVLMLFLAPYTERVAQAI